MTRRDSLRSIRDSYSASSSSSRGSSFGGRVCERASVGARGECLDKTFEHSLMADPSGSQKPRARPEQHEEYTHEHMEQAFRPLPSSSTTTTASPSRPAGSLHTPHLSRVRIMIHVRRPQRTSRTTQSNRCVQPVSDAVSVHRPDKEPRIKRLFSKSYRNS